MTFDEKLLAVRAQLNLSQTELAKQLNVSYATISRWENKKSKPTKKGLLIFNNFCIRNKINFNEDGIRNV